jgi:hypothetical protein
MGYGSDDCGVSVDTSSNFDIIGGNGGTCCFWCIFSFIIGLVLASWSHALLFYIVFAIALFFIKGYYYDFKQPWHAGEACLAILFGIAGLIIGRSLIGKHAK